MIVSVRIAAWWWLVSVSACYAPNTPTGIPCASASVAERCPEGQICVTRDGREVCDRSASPSDAAFDATSLDATIDGDGDGIPDVVDDCPNAANPRQENEDGDRFGDICDPCPVAADNNPPDADLDGVADACDPRPLVPGDKIVLFEGFHDGVPASWAKLGNWSAGADLVATNSAGIVSSSLTVPLTTTAPVMVWARIIPTAFVASGVQVISSTLQYNTNDLAGIQCELVSGTPPTQNLYDLGNNTVFGSVPGGVAIGNTYDLKLGWTGSGYSCAIFAQSISAAHAASGATGANFGVHMIRTSAEVAFVLVVDASG